jgi:hypothetical protein
MKTPQEFIELAQGFYSGSDREYQDGQAWIDGTVSIRPKTHLPIIEDYLSGLLAASGNSEQLMEIWNKCDPDVWFETSNDLRDFLILVLDSVNRANAASR